MMGNGWGMNGWGMGLAGFGTLLLLAAVVAGAVLLVRYLAPGPGSRRAHRPDPQDILAARFARGEIDEREYRRGLDVLDEQDDRPLTGP